MAYLFEQIFFSNGRTNGQTNGWSDYIMPQILFGGIKTTLFNEDNTFDANQF